MPWEVGVMAVLSLLLYATLLLLAFGVRTLLQRRRTGDTGFRMTGERPGSAAWWARLLFAAALLTGLAAPIADLAGLSPVRALDRTVVHVVGATLAGLDILGVVGAQLAMGDAWRIGVDPTERTRLVTRGPFRLVRNPIFTAMAVAAVGLTLLVPNSVAIAGLILLLAALQLQVRVVEEPYLQRMHGSAYQHYAATVGRFLPRLGRLDPPSTR